MAEVERTLRKVDTLLEIGPGIHPQTQYADKAYLAIEPHWEYVEYLLKQNLLVLQVNALSALPFIRRVDSVFLLDVLEHMEKKEGERVLEHCKRIAREQVAVFTPLGFQEQAYVGEEKDAWGMNGQFWQTHRSGWVPEDFQGWNIGVNLDFHGAGKGAIYAVWEAPRV